MSVAARLTGAFGFLALLLAGMMAYHISTTRQAVATSYELSAIFGRLQLASTRQLDGIDMAASKYWVTRDAGYRSKLDDATGAFDRLVRGLSEAHLTPPERQAAARLELSWRAFPPVARRFEAAVAAGDEAAAGASLATLRQRLSDLDGRLRRLGDASRQAAIRRLDESTAAARAATRISLAAIFVALLLGVLAAASVVRSIARSLGRLRDGTREVAQGNFGYRIDAGPEQELAELARDFNRMTERLGELDRMKQDFLSKVSHDLKTPLASMQETTRILQDEVPGPLTPKQRHLLELSSQTGDRLSSMIAKILDLSALEAGTVPLELRRNDLAALARRAVESAAPAAAERGISLSMALPDAPVPVDCDAEPILRVLDNLLENAVKFSAEGDAVIVAVGSGRETDSPPRARRTARGGSPAGDGAAAGVALLSVTDSGPGVPDEDKERIFERFFQSASGRRTRRRGVGLGLTICREIVEAHHGAIWVADNPAGGSTFSIALPLAMRASARRPHSPAATPRTSVSARI